MGTYLLSLRVKGIKNIDKEIEIQFYNKTIPSIFKLNKSNIKAIYGENGVGKTSIIHAMDIYKDLVYTSNYLSNDATTTYLDEIVNKKLQSFSLGCTFLVYDDQTKKILGTHSHDINVIRQDYAYEIMDEKVFDYRNNVINDKNKELIYASRDGVIEVLKLKNDSAQFLLDKTKNLLDKTSIIYQMGLCFNELREDYSQAFFAITGLILLFSDTSVIFSKSDEHYDFLSKEAKSYKIVSQLDKIYKSQGYIFVKENVQAILKEDLEAYSNKVERLSKFIKIFKTDLLSIEIEIKEIDDFVQCTKYFVYKDYRVHSEFESTGVKKLINLFNELENFNKGKIVFIDELDANLHDVYLCKLLEFFKEYAKGQLCFTTHNLGPMEVLKKSKHSIDFLSNDSQLVSWKNSGNYSVTNMYREGMIKNSPFNVEAIDFLGIFSNGEEGESECN